MRSAARANSNSAGSPALVKEDKVPQDPNVWRAIMLCVIGCVNSLCFVGYSRVKPRTRLAIIAAQTVATGGLVIGMALI
jgi:hypothetical protein